MRFTSRVFSIKHVVCLAATWAVLFAAAQAGAVPVAEWTFDGEPTGLFTSATDSVSGLIATPYNSQNQVTVTLAPEGHALRLQNAGITDAQGATVSVPDTAYLTGHNAGGSGFDSFTIEADIRINTLTGQTQIVRKIDSSTGHGYELYVRSNGQVGFNFSGPGGDANAVSKNVIAADGNWHHIEGTFVGSRDLYNTQVVVDGVVTRRTHDPVTLANTTSPLTFGGFIRSSGTSGQLLDGWIDNVRLSTDRGDLLDVSGAIDPTPAWDSSDHLTWQAGFQSSQFIADPMPTPEIHAASITQRANGDMVAVWFGGTTEGHPDVGVWQSEFNGNQWTTPHEIAPGTFTSGTQGSIFNPVIYQIPNTNSMILFYLKGPLGSAVGKTRTSNDGGVTWSQEQSNIPGIRGADRNQPVLLENGTLLAPNTNGGLNFDRSNDFGEHWLSSSSVPDPEGIGGIQPAILVHDDGTLQTLGRSQSGKIVTSWSTDNGLMWSDLELTNMPNNNSAIAATTLDDGRFLLVYNHSETPSGAWGGPRTPLNVAISDDGVNWSAAMVLEDESGEYSYPAVYQADDGKVHVVYTWNRVRIKHAVLDPDALPEVPIINGVWPDIPIPGDIDGDGFVGIADLNIVLGNWNAGTPPNDTSNIPEPATAALLLLFGVSLLAKRRHPQH